MLQFHGLRIDGTWTWVRTVVHDHVNWRLERHANPHAYEQSIHDLLQHQIWHNPVGRIVIAQLVAHAGHRTVTLVPYRGEENAFATPDNPDTATERGQLERDQFGVPLPSGAVGRGGGSNVNVLFTPGMWRHHPQAGADPASTLTHELFHAIRDTRGHDNSLGRPDHWDNIEELFAVMVQNIYLSANHMLFLRASHLDYWRPAINGHPLVRLGGRPVTAASLGTLGLLGDVLLDTVVDAPGRMRPDETFTHQHEADIRQLIHQEPDVCQLIAQVRCHFNPLHDLLGGSAYFLAPFYPGELPPAPAMPRE